MTGLLLLLSGVAHAGLTDAELRSIRDEILPVVEEVAGRRFPATPQVDARPSGNLGDVLDDEAQALARIFYPQVGPAALRLLDSQGLVGRHVFGKFGLFDQRVYVRADLAKAWKATLRKRGGKPTEAETEEALATCVLAHELTHALQFAHTDMERVVQSGDIEWMRAVNALGEGHATAVGHAVCARLTSPALASRMATSLGVDVGAPREAGDAYRTRYEAGLAFVRGHDDIWSVFAAPPVDTAMVYRPDRYRPDTAIAPFPAWPALEAAADALADGPVAIRIGERAGYEDLLGHVHRAGLGEAPLDGLVAVHVETVTQGYGSVELLVVETTGPEAADTLLGALEKTQAWRTRPDRRWESPTFVEPPAPAPAPLAGWQSGFTVRPQTKYVPDRVTRTWGVTRGRWVVRAHMVQVQPDDCEITAALDALLTALDAATPTASE